MKKITKLTSVLIAVLSVVCGTSVQAQLINVQLAGQRTGTSPTMSGAAIIGSAGDVWNYYNVGAGVNATPAPSGFLVNSSNVATGASFTLTAVGGDSVFTTGIASGNALNDSYAYIGAGVTVAATQVNSATLTLNGLTAGGLYNLIVYSKVGTIPADNFPETFAVNGGTPQTPPGVFADLYNYTQFTNVTATGGTLTLNWIMTGSSSQNGILNGFQLQAVPEPSTILMLILGLGSLVGLRIMRKSSASLS
jgi:hypothetical protein